MRIKIGTFNVNNLFSRWNFRAEIDAVKDGETTVDATVTYSFDDPATYTFRTYQGTLIKGKSSTARGKIADRITQMDLDVLAVQEVEDIDTLRGFAENDLAGMYPFQVLVEGNDRRFIDLGVLSKLPIGSITSWRYAVHEDDPQKSVFGRDLLEVEIWNASRSRKLFTVYNNHLKSHFIPWWYEDKEAGAKYNNQRRERQAETVARIVEAQMRPNSKFIILGDMNDPPASGHLAGLVDAPGLGLVDALADPAETRKAKKDDPPPASKAWTHRYKPSGKPAEYRLYDHIWLSPALAGTQVEAWIDRRKLHGGDGSDHDPAWVVLEL